jgi:hypothetical protein
MSPITKFAQYTPYDPSPTSWGVPVPSAIEEIRRTGFVGQYYGVNIIGLPQVWKSDIEYTPLLPEDKLLVIGENVGEFIIYDDLKTKAWTDMNPTPPVFITEMYQRFGLIVDRQIGIYVLDNVT